MGSNGTMYDSEKMKEGVKSLLNAFAEYGTELESLADIGENFFGNPEGAIYTKKVSATLKEVWDDHISNDFNSFVDGFDVWIGQATAEQNILEDYKYETVNLYDRILDYEKSNDPNASPSILPGSENDSLDDAFDQLGIDKSNFSSTGHTNLAGQGSDEIAKSMEVSEETKKEIMSAAESTTLLDAATKYGADSPEYAYFEGARFSAFDKILMNSKNSQGEYDFGRIRESLENVHMTRQEAKEFVEKTQDASAQFLLTSIYGIALSSAQQAKTAVQSFAETALDAAGELAGKISDGYDGFKKTGGDF